MNLLKDLDVAREIFNLLPISIFVKDAHSKFRLMNHACEESWGIAYPDIAGTDGSQFFPENQMSSFLAADKAIFQNRVTVELEEEFWSKKYRSNRIGLTTKKPIYDEDGQPKFLICMVRDITEQRKADQSLRFNEEKLYKLFEMSPLGITRNAMDGKFLDVNRAFLDIAGYSDRQIKQRSYRDLTPEKYNDLDNLQLQQVLVDGKYGPYEKQFINSDNEIIEVKLTGILVDDPTAPYIWSFVENISEQKRITTQLMESEARMKIIADSVPVALALNDKYGNITYLNQRFQELIGYTLDDIPILGAWWMLAYPNESYRKYVLETWQERMAASVSGKSPFEPMEVNIQCKDGQNRTFVAHAAEFPNDFDGLHLISLADITEQKASSKKMHESKLLLQTVIDATPDWIFVKDRNQTFVLVNKSFAAALGLSPEAVIGRTDIELMPMEMCIGNAEKGIRGFHQDDQAVLNGEIIHDSKYKWVSENGAVRYFDMVKGPMRDAANQITGIFCYEREITGRINGELEQQALETRLWQAQKMELIWQLTGGIAHDFNNVLAAMLGYSELLEMSPELKNNPTLNGYLQEVLNGGRRARELVEQLLAFSRKTSLAIDYIEVKPVIAEVVKLLRSTIPSAISVQTSIGTDLGQVLISPINLHQVLMNLCINARDSIDGSGTITVSASVLSLEGARQCTSCQAHFAGEFLMLAVTDTGSGIFAENCHKLFDPFFTTKEIGRGSGLGLSVVHGIVHSCAGHIEVLPHYHHGSVFRVYLPHKKLHLDGEPKIEDAVAGNYRLSGTVMVVDDEPSIVGFLTSLLSGSGCKVIGLTSSVEALRQFRADPLSIDLVITDQTMPELQGLELAQAMLEICPGLPVIIITGNADSLPPHIVSRTGVSAVLNKPVASRLLIDCVATYLKTRT